MATILRTAPRALAPILAALLACLAAAGAAPVPSFHMPVPVVRTLPNGLRVAVFQYSRLPLVQMKLLIPGGVAQESGETPGAASATAQLLRAGTSSRSAEDFAADVDRLGGSITATAGRDYSTVDGTFLSADFETGLELLADAVVSPIFPPEEIQRYQALAGTILLQLRQDPAAVADNSLWTLAFGDHPYGRRPLGTLETLPRLDRDAVQAFHRDFYRPDRAILAIAGDVDPERAFAAAADRFGSWAGHSATLPRSLAPAPAAAMRIRLVDRPGLAESAVRMGLVGPARDNPDVLPLQLVNYLLGGGGPASRLAQSLRVDSGLSYDARSGYTILRDAGLVSLGTTAGNDSVAVIIRRMRGELARLAAQAPGEAELAAARHYFQNSYALQFQTLGALLTQWTALDFYGLSPDSLDRYVESAGDVTAARVHEVASRWLDPAHLAVVVVGPGSVLEKPLEVLGPVEVVTGEVASPATAAAGPAPTTPEQKKRGRELLDRALAAHGGIERLRHVDDSTVNGDMVMQMGGNDVTVHMQQVRKNPLRFKFATRIASMENGQILDGTQGWAYTGSTDSVRVSDADSAGLVAMQSAFRSDILHVLLAAADPTAEVAWRGPGRLGGRDADVIEVTTAPPGAQPERSQLYLDAENHQLLGMDLGASATKPGVYSTRRLYRDYRTVNGVLWPFYEERLIGGTRTMTILLDSVVLNSGVSDQVFAKPVPLDVREPPR